MSFGITGFGGGQLYPQPQVFQALSLSGAPPLAPSPPYGTPNANLVPVQRTGNPSVPANLTLAASPVFQALLKLNPTVVGFQNQPVGAGAPNTTNAVGATNPAVGQATVVNTNTTNAATAPQGPVSFSLTATPAYVTSGVDALKESTANAPVTPAPDPAKAGLQPQQSGPQLTSAPSIPPSKSPQYVEPSSGSLVQRIVSTIQQLAASAVYPAPVFSFSA